MSAPRNYLVNVLAQGTSRVLSMGAAFVLYVVAARVYGSEIFGQFALVMAFLGIAANLADMGTTAAMAQGLSRASDRPLYFGNFLMLRGAGVIAVTLLGAAVALGLDDHLSTPMLVAALGLPFVTARFFEPVYQIFERPGFSVYSMIAYSSAQITIAVVLLLWMGAGLEVLLIGYVSCSALYCLVASRLVLRVVRPRWVVHAPTLRGIVLLAAPMGVSALFTTLNSRADTFMLEFLRGSAEVGLYNAAYRLLDMGAVLAVTATVPLIPILSQRLSRDRAASRPACMRAYELVAVATLPVAIVTPYVSRSLIVLIYGAPYASAAPVLEIFAWIWILLGYAMLGSAINLAVRDVRHAYWNAALAAAINIALNLVVIPRYGIIGAAWATLVSTASMVFVSQCYVWRNMGWLFSPSRWLRLGAAALALQQGLHAFADDGAVIPIVLCLAGYLGLVLALRLIPLDHLAAWKGVLGRLRAG